MGRRSRRTPRTTPADPGACRRERRDGGRVCRPPNRPSRDPLGRSGADRRGQVPSRNRVCWRWRKSLADSSFRPTTRLRRRHSRPSSRDAASSGDQRPIGARGGRPPRGKMTPVEPRSTGAACSGARARPSSLTPRPAPRRQAPPKSGGTRTRRLLMVAVRRHGGSHQTIWRHAESTSTNVRSRPRGQYIMSDHDHRGSPAPAKRDGAPELRTATRNRGLPPRPPLR